MAITIYGCQVNTLSRDYKHVMDFNSPSSQLDYFLRQAWFTNSQNIQGDGFLESLVVPQTLSTCKKCDYLFFRGLDEKVYYYFITKVEYVTQNTTRLHLELDVFSTYLFEMQYLPSFVRRCHVNRWDNEGLPTLELTPEPFQCQNYVIKNKLPIHKNNEGVYIYTTSSPLGDMKSDKGGTGGNDKPVTPPSVGGCGDLNLGIASKNGFLFIKGFEGLAQYAHNIGDGVLTIGYGCTDRYDGSNYQQLKSNEPVSDELASVVFANSLTENYGIPLINRLDADGITVTQQEFDALLSFVYNAGLGSLTNSAIYSNLKTGNKQASAQAWLTTNILSGSQFEQGLRDRRQAEANIFLNGQYDIRDTLIYGQGGSISGTLYTSTSSVPPLIENTCQSTNPELVNEMTKDELGNNWMLPVKGIVTATFPTYPDGTTHSGFDIAGNDGLKIRSSGIGTVVYVGTDTSSGYGNHVVVEMENGTRHWFGHMKTTPYVHVGDSVNQSTVLGIVGSTGNSTGSHVHWEIRKPPYAYDFTCWVNPSPRHKVGDIVKGVGD